MSRDLKFKINEIGELVANFLAWFYKLAFLIHNNDILLFTFEMNLPEV